MAPSFHGTRFTWADGRGLGRVRRRLDWVFVNSLIHDRFEDFKLSHLPRVASDHTPLLLQCRISSTMPHHAFRFLDAWLLHSEFPAYVQHAWQSYPTTGGMRGFYDKLFALKKDIQRWNKDVFGNIFRNLKHAESLLSQAKARWDDDPSQETRQAFHKAKADYFLASNYELHFWQQKARVKWLKDGDANTQYFHSVVKGKCAQLRIQQIRNSEGQLLTSQDDIMASAVEFYTALFAQESTDNHSTILSHIPSLLTTQDNLMLTGLPTELEVKTAVWSLDPHSASGPDGFHGHFYRSCWNVIHLDVLKAVQEFFLGISQPSIMARALITLIPKVSSPQTFSDFRPICLTNFLSKVCTRIIATRLGTLLPRLVSLEQTGFLPGHDISSQV